MKKGGNIHAINSSICCKAMIHLLVLVQSYFLKQVQMSEMKTGD